MKSCQFRISVDQKEKALEWIRSQNIEIDDDEVRDLLDPHYEQEGYKYINIISVTREISRCLILLEKRDGDEWPLIESPLIERCDKKYINQEEIDEFVIQISKL